MKRIAKYKGNKTKMILIPLILAIISIVFFIRGINSFDSLTKTLKYYSVNSRVSKISNEEIRKFVQYNIDGDKYIYTIIYYSDPFYNGGTSYLKIEYEDNGRKEKGAHIKDKKEYIIDFIKIKGYDRQLYELRIMLSLAILSYVALYCCSIYILMKITLPQVEKEREKYNV